jgi:hypothetical protein
LPEVRDYYSGDLVVTRRTAKRPLGDAFRASTAPPDASVLNNFPGQYPTEDWRVFYWTVDEQGELADRSVTLQFPAGFGAACAHVALGEPGCVYKVRRWGIACYPSILSEIEFDPAPLVTGDAARFPGGEGQELLHIYLHATHFDLPGHFVIADRVYPLLLFDPTGALKGSWQYGPTYMGALAWQVSGGTLDVDFELMRTTAPWLYQRVEDDLLRALRQEGETNSDGD